MAGESLKGESLPESACVFSPRLKGFPDARSPHSWSMCNNKTRPNPVERRKPPERVSSQPHFFARGGGGVNRIEHLLHFERFLRQHERLLSLQHASDEMMDPVLVVGDDRQCEVDGFVS